MPGFQPLMGGGMFTWGCHPSLRWDAPLVLKRDEPPTQYQSQSRLLSPDSYGIHPLR